MNAANFCIFSAVIVSALCSVASAFDDNFVTCGSAIKLTHVESGNKYFLQSDEQQLQSGSGQQLVTAIENDRSPKGLWQVREGSEEGICEVGTPVKCGQTVRLTHVITGSNLHTHGIKSPLSNQHEVTGFGQDGSGDSGDDWKVVCETGSYFGGANEFWKRDALIQLRSIATNRYLGASSTVKFTQQNCGRGCPILDNLEVFGRSSNDSYSHWKVELGVHIYK